jgi:hypothetical protein
MVLALGQPRRLVTRVLYERPDTYAYGGGGGIRTPETLASLTVFKAGDCALARW